MQASVYTLVTTAATVFTLWLAYTLWSRRPGVGVNAIVLMAIGIALFTFASGLEVAFIDYSAKLIALQVIYLGVVIVPPTWLVFTMQYTGHDKWITRNRLLLFLIEPIIIQLLILSGDTHNTLWASRNIFTADGLVLIDYQHALGFWIHTAYSYVVLLVGAVYMVRSFMRSPHVYRGQMRYMLIAISAPWIANAIYIFGLSPLPVYMDITPLAFVVTAAALAWSLYRFRLMDVVPVARDTIIDNMDDAILVLDSQNRLLDINRAALNLLRLPSSSTLIGQPAAVVLKEQAALVSEYRNVPEVDTNVTAQIDGAPRTFNLRITPLRNRQQELSGRVVVLHDITVMQEANDQLTLASQRAEEASRLKSEFLATISHELRTPLNAIIGYTEIILMGMSGELNSTQRDYQQRVLVNAQHLLAMINSILDLSKLEAGHLKLIEKSFNTRAWVDEVVGQVAVLGQNKNLEFVSEIDSAMPDRLIGDSVMLRQIVVNLLSNAFKFTKEGSVKLSVRREDDLRWSISVADTGIGIPKDKLSKIFSEFYQVDSSMTREYGGTGLGLAIVRRLVTQMNGAVNVVSTVGEGSTFTVTLPLKEEKVVARIG